MKFNEDLRKQIVLRLAMGEAVSNVHAWIIEDKHIQCSPQAVYGYLRRKKWQRFMNTITRIELDNPEYSLLFYRAYEERQKRFVKLETLFLEVMEKAVSRNPLRAQDFMEAVRVLKRMRERPPLKILSKFNTC